MRFKRVTENNGVIPGILGALEHYPEVYAFRVEGEGARGRRPVVPKGIADILGILRAKVGSMGSIGIAFAIETKATHGVDCGRKGCSCEDQRKWRATWEKAGGLYILATTVQQAVDGVMGQHRIQPQADAVAPELLEQLDRVTHDFPGGAR